MCEESRIILHFWVQVGTSWNGSALAGVGMTDWMPLLRPFTSSDAIGQFKKIEDFHWSTGGNILHHCTGVK